jgi:YjbE family integral membrane protein
VDYLLTDFMQPAFWVAVSQIIGVNVILSGDNAVVIALACMTLPPRQRLWGMILGAGVAVLLRVLFTLVVAQAMTYPFLKLVGGLLLFYVAVKLVVPEEDEGGGKVESAENLWRAVRIVAIADIVMSLDNVIAIAAAAESAAVRVDLVHASAIKATLIIFGLVTSVPLIVAGSALLMALLERYRILVWAGGALLGFIAGDIMITDPSVVNWLGDASVHFWHPWAGRAGAVLVVALGLLFVRRRRPFTAEEILAAIGLAIWIIADIFIERGIGESELLQRWIARGALLVVLTLGYMMGRKRLASAGET